MKSKKIKNALLVTISLALVAAASVAITWAATYVGDKLTPAVNTQTSGDLAIALDEPWYTFNEKHGTTNTSYTEEDSTKLPPHYPKTLVPSMKKGSTIAGAYNANTLIPKNPEIWNTDAGTDAFVAMGVRYQVTFGADTYNNADLAAGHKVTGTSLVFDDSSNSSTDGWFVFNEIAQLMKDDGSTAGINTGWTEDTSRTTNLYYYDTPVSKATGATADVATGAPLFSFVKIKNLAAESSGTASGYYKIQVSNGNYYYTKTLPGFKISLKGYAVDANSFYATLASSSTQTDDSKTALKALYDATNGIPQHQS